MAFEGASEGKTKCQFFLDFSAFYVKIELHLLKTKNITH